MSDIVKFGALVKEYRTSKKWSQSKLAETAFNNANRGSFVSDLEKQKKKDISPENVVKLATALDMKLEVIPPALLPHHLLIPADHVSQASQTVIEQLEELLLKLRSANADPHQLIDSFTRRSLAEKIEKVLAVSPMQLYRMLLVRNLRILTKWTGRPFGMQSLGFCLTASFVYVILAGFCAFATGGGNIGQFAPFSVPEWAEGVQPANLALVSFLLMALTCTLIWLLLKPTMALRGDEPAWLRVWKTCYHLRVVSAATLSGLGAGAASVFGSEIIIIAMITSLVAFMVLSQFDPWKATLLAASASPVGGALGAWLAFGPTMALVFGFVGIIIGGVAVFAASYVTHKSHHKAAGMLAGGGFGLGLAAALAGIALAYSLERYNIDHPHAPFMHQQASLLLVVAVVLPLTNAFSDYISLGISHFLARHIVKTRPSISRTVLIASIDALAALCLLVLIVVLVPASIVGIESILNTGASATDFARAIASEPFGSGLWFTIMILSTLLWTFFHFAIVAVPSVSMAMLSRLLLPKLIAFRESSQSGDVVDSTLWLMLRFPASLLFGTVAFTFFLLGTVLFLVAKTLLGFAPLFGLEPSLFELIGHLAEHSINFLGL